jgi:O-antigen ligase
LFLLMSFLMLINPKVLHLDGNAGNAVQKLLIILTGVAFVTTRPRHLGVVLLICAIPVLAMVCAVGSDWPGFERRLFIGGMVGIIAPFALLVAQPERRDRDMVLLVFASLPVLMTLLGAVYQVVGLGAAFQSDPLVGTRLAGTQNAPAILAGAAFTGTVAALELAEQRHIGFIALLFLDVAVLAFTGGRAAFGLAALICALEYVRSFRRFPLLKFFLPIWFMSFAAIAFVALRGDALRHLTSTTLSKRELIWAALWRHLDAHPWFGVGLGNQQLLMPADLKGQGVGTIAGHNEYLRLAVELGYPGAVIFYLITVGIFFMVWNSTWVRRDPFFLFCVLAFYLFSLTDNTFSVPQIFFILTVASFAGRGESAAPVEGKRRLLLMPSRTVLGAPRPGKISAPD